MQPRPTAAELLATVAEVIERDIVPALEGPVQHHARVAASLVAIVERELRLGPAAAAAELGAIQRLLSGPDPTGGWSDPALSATLPDARARLAAALRDGLADDPAMAREVWAALMEISRADLSICKPGHDSWEGD
ncbi:MAG: DUF6285 domain-containing protein [Ilumatobacteraceae bacterium]